MVRYSIIFDHWNSDIQRFTKSLITTHDPNLAVSPEINLKFSCNAFTFNGIIYEDVSPHPHLLTEFQTFPDLFSHKNEFEIQARVIKNSPVGNRSYQEKEILEFALLTARKTIVTTPWGRNIVRLHVRVAALHTNFFVGRPNHFPRAIRRLMDLGPVAMFLRRDSDSWSHDQINWMAQRFTDIEEVLMAMEDSGSSSPAPVRLMVPAEDSSIKSLERKLVIRTDSGACTICLDEFSGDCEAICMPCSHFFHGDCIKKWLRTSHYCPICRFEMPTS